MPFAYIASFDVADVVNGFSTVQFGATSVQLTALTVPTQASATTLTSCFNHWAGLGTTTGLDELSTANALGDGFGTASFASVLQDKVRTQSGSSSWGVAFNVGTGADARTTFSYTLSFSTTFALTFGNIATARLLGFNTLTLSGASSYTSTQTPDFCLVPVLLRVSTTGVRDGLMYEPEGIAVQSMSNTGRVFGLSRSVSPQFCDWTQQFESPQKLFNNRSGGLFTHQKMAWRVRTELPFVLLDGFGYGTHTVHYLRDGLANIEYSSAGADVQGHARYETICIGTIP